MLILIAESKTMALCDALVSHDEYINRCPLLEADADMIMDGLRSVTVDELMERVKISLPMARKLQRMIYEFPNKAVGAEAMPSFTGVVFKAFSWTSLTSAEKERACGSVRIISSLYGWLRPDDVIKAYRFDFTTALAPEGKTLAVYHKKAVTACLLRELEMRGETEIINLLPGDAERCIDWKQLAGKARVWKADFREIQPGGNSRTPNSNQLKTLRGRLLRQIISCSISSVSELMSVESNDYLPVEATEDPACGYLGTLLFHTAPKV